MRNGSYTPAQGEEKMLNNRLEVQLEQYEKMNDHDRSEWVMDMQLRHRDQALLSVLATLIDHLGDLEVAKPIHLAPISEELEEDELTDDEYEEGGDSPLANEPTGAAMDDYPVHTSVDAPDNTSDVAMSDTADNSMDHTTDDSMNHTADDTKDQTVEEDQGYVGGDEIESGSDEEEDYQMDVDVNCMFGWRRRYS